MDALAATSINEDELCRWLFSREIVGRELARHLQVGNDAIAGHLVKTTKICPEAEGPGDIDVLAINASDPSQAIAIEVKRIKVKPKAFLDNKPNKLGDLPHGVEQANLLAKLGFHRPMMMVVVVADGRELEGLNFASRGITFDLARLIDNDEAFKKLAPNVELVFVELSQPADKPITSAGGIGIRTARQGIRAKQTMGLTASIASHFNLQMTRPD